MRFNPPPNWPPSPPGWQPDPTWQPDPEWGPAPPNWPLWLEDKKRTRLIVTLVVAAVLVAGAVTAAFLLWPSSDSKTKSGREFADAIPCKADTSEEQAVCAAIRERYAASFDGDRTKLQKMSCEGFTAIPQEQLDMEKQMYQSGQAKIEITDIAITGNSAVISFTATATEPQKSGPQSVNGQVTWSKQDGQWKSCGAIVRP